MENWEAAQAAELVRALCVHLREMTRHLARVESHDVPGTDSHPMRLQAVALRRDIAEAQMHVDRLQRRYLSGGEHIQQRRAVGEQHRAMVNVQAK
ncbi:MAG: hypothetical protein WBZ37_27265 [Mycobacterium sp.]